MVLEAVEEQPEIHVGHDDVVPDIPDQVADELEMLPVLVA